MSQPERAPIPKFGSFPTRKTTKPDDSKGLNRTATARRDEPRRKRKRDRKTSIEDDSLRAPVSSSGVQSIERRPSPRFTGKSDDFFIVDRRGDTKNTEYGSIHRYDVPLHHRTGNGRLLGAPPTVRLDRNDNNLKQAVLIVEGRGIGSVDRPLASRRSCESKKKIKMLSFHSRSTWDLESDEIKLGSRGKGTASPTQDEALVDYRSINGRSNNAEGSADEDLELVSETEAEGATLAEDVAARHENAILLRRTKENVTDLQGWLKLIDHQRNVLFPEKEASRLTSSERRALADVRLSIYQNAITHFSNMPAQMEELILGIMTERQSLLDTAQLSTKWLEVLREHPTSIKVWMKYLDFVQGSHYAFKFEEVKAEHLKCLQIISRAGRKSSDPTQLLLNQVYVLTRLTAFIRDAGYTELATSIWQAVLELSMSSRDGDFPDNAPIDAFETFWEADVPRIGEGAVGFDHFKTHGAAALRPLMTAQDEPTKASSLVEFAQQESRLAGSCFLPATGTEDSNDPFRFVLFADIKEIIEAILPGIRLLHLINGFLAHHHMPPLKHSCGTERSWQMDQYLNQTEQVTFRPLSLSWLFSTAFDGVKSSTSHDTSVSGEHRFVDKVLDNICLTRPDLDVVAEYYIAFKMHLLPQELSRAKKLIKARPQSLRLYNAYALAEARLGRTDKAREVWRRASTMMIGSNLATQHDSYSLYCSWLQTELEATERDKAAEVLAYIGASAELGGKDISSSVVRLRVEQELRQQWAVAVDQKRFPLAVAVAECMTWFQYITGLDDVEAAIEELKLRAAILLKHNATNEVEILHETKIRLITYHLDSHRTYKPSTIRAELRETLKLFPNNSSFLKTYANYESRFDLNDRIRAPFRDELRNAASPTLATLAFAIDQELHRYKESAGGSTEHSVRSLFVRVLLQSSPAQHSFSLWKKWLLFELPSSLISGNGVGDARCQQMSSRARQVFLDGLRYLPWHKEWALLGMGSEWAPGGMTEKELQQVYDMLFERELRVRVEM